MNSFVITKNMKEMISVDKPKLPKVKEYGDALFINGYEVPYVALNDDGTTTTKAVAKNGFVEVTITFCVESYYLDPHKRVHGSFYKFKKKPWYKRLFSKLKAKLREHC